MRRGIFMKYMKFSVVLLVVLIVCSCAKANMSEKTADVPVTSAIFNLTASASSTPQSAEPGVYTELADFLTEEQIELYNKASEIYPLFSGMPDAIDYLHLSLQGRPWDEKNNYVVNYKRSDDIAETYRINDLLYVFCKGEYQTIDAFHELCLSVFTDTYYKKLNDSGFGVPSFIQINDSLYHISTSKGGVFGYDPIESPDTYVLVSRSDTEICFDVIGHYAQDDAEETRSFPITLTRTESGWRFSQFADAGLDEPYNATGSSAKLTAVSALSAKVNALPESAEKARFKYALIGGSPVVYVFDDDMRFYLAYLNIDMHFASVYECTLMLPAGYTDGQIIAVKGGGGSGEYFISVAAKAGEKNVILDYFFFSNGDLPQPKSVEVFSCVE